MKSKTSPNPIKPHHKVLYNHFITPDQPGTILRDFGTLLRFIRDAQPLKVTASSSLLPLKLMPQLNERMANPLELDFKRPQHKSFPNILGLFLLLRTTGLAFLEGSGSKRVLVIDEDVLQSWNSLNPTEQYFMLLETALLRASAEIIDEHRGGLFDNPIYKWQHFLQSLLKGDIKIAGNPTEQDRLLMYPGMYNLTLLWMFGLVEIQDDTPDPGKGWKILRIGITPLGSAIYQELDSQFESLQHDFWGDDWEQYPKEAPIGKLQSRFQPFFPEWQHNLTISDYELQEGTYIFKVTVWKNVWRRIAIPGHMLLDRLSDAILEAFKFGDVYHLYRFIYTNRFGVEKHIDHPELHEGFMKNDPSPTTDRTTVQEVPLRPGRSMIFFFDFGDCWQFEVLLEEIAPSDPNLKHPKILETHGKAPKQYEW